MLYLNEQHIERLRAGFAPLAAIIESACRCLDRQDYAQPLKPYLRYGDRSNRIIAMPAYVGGAVNTAGLKWIASFPGNLRRGLPRADSLLVLNDADTGRVIAMISGALASALRTAAVSGAFLRRFSRLLGRSDLEVGIAGFGPIGRAHLQMMLELFGASIARINLFDLRPLGAEAKLDPRVRVVDSWQRAYDGADVFITCTVTAERYIDRPPKPGSLHLNVSLRDYRPEVFEYFHRGIVVDDWAEICREGTDVEVFHTRCGLLPADTRSLAELVCGEGEPDYPPQQPIMLNPMGMAVFDVAIGRYFFDRGTDSVVGVQLP